MSLEPVSGDNVRPGGRDQLFGQELSLLIGNWRSDEDLLVELAVLAEDHCLGEGGAPGLGRGEVCCGGGGGLCVHLWQGALGPARPPAEGDQDGGEEDQGGDDGDDDSGHDILLLLLHGLRGVRLPRVVQHQTNPVLLIPLLHHL